jgi:uncharacterized membrane protein AbrB (regulator of aidB expression)
MLRFLETVLITVVFGLLFTWLRVPLSWMLGPLAGVLLWTGFTRRQLSFPLWLRTSDWCCSVMRWGSPSRPIAPGRS